MVLVLWVRLQTLQTRGSVHREAVGDEEEDEGRGAAPVACMGHERLPAVKLLDGNRKQKMSE